MMRAWAAIAAAAVLMSLPTAVAGAAADVAAQDTSAPVAVTGDAHPLAPGSLGVVLWLTVAVIAVIVAVVGLRRSRAQLVGPSVAPAFDRTTVAHRVPSATAGR